MVTRRGLSLSISGSICGWVTCGEDAVGGAERPTAAGGVNKDADMGSAHTLHYTLTNGSRPMLGVSKVVETSQAVGQQTQVGGGKSK